MSPRRPETYRELMLVHPFELALSFMLLLAGARGLAAGATASEAVDHVVGPWLSAVWQILTVLGAGTVFVSLMLAPLAARRGVVAEAANRNSEQAGLVLMAMAAVVFSVVIVAVTGPDALYAIAQSVAIGFGCIMRVRRLRRADRATIATLRAINASSKDDDDAARG